MKSRILSIVLALALVLCIVPFASAQEAGTEVSPVVDVTPLIGSWSLNVADYPSFAEEGLTQGTITMELKADGTGCTYYEGMLTSTYGYIFYMNYYAAVTPDGEAESAFFSLSEDGLVLTLKALDGEWELAYHKVVE